MGNYTFAKMIVLTSIALYLVSCQKADDLIFTANADTIGTSVPATEPIPTYTLQPTHTPYPTLTPFPTHTLQPTFTPLPTYTTQPTLTPYPTEQVSASSEPETESGGDITTGDNSVFVGEAGGDVSVDVEINEAPEFRTKTFVAGESQDIIIPLYSEAPTSLFDLSIGLFVPLSYRTEVILLGKQQEVGLALTTEEDETNALDGVLGEFLESIQEGLVVVKVEVASGPHDGKEGWVPSHFIMTEEVEVTGE